MNVVGDSSRLADRIAHAPRPLPQPLYRIRIGAGDRPLVEPGQRVEAGSPLLERSRGLEVAEARLPEGLAPPAPGQLVERGVPLAGQGRRSLHFEGSGRILYTTPGGIVRAAVSRSPVQALACPAVGVVEAVGPNSLTVRADGIGLPVALVVGGPTSGRLRLAVDAPDGQLPAGAIDVGAAGAVLVAGARLDLEALGRARAMGVRAVVTGGVISRDLRGLVASESRQRAALHAGQPFALAVIDGYGKRPIPAGTWDLLRSADDREVGLVADPPLVILPLDLPRPVNEEPDRVRICGGPLLGREGTLVAAAEARRVLDGLEQLTALVRLDTNGAGEGPEVRPIALADLQRLG
jgi:hypothetical protein